MKSRREAREATVQLLYAAELADVEPRDVGPEFWLLREERERDRIAQSQAKAAIKLTKAFEARLEHLEKHRPNLEATLPAVDVEGRIAGHLGALIKALKGLIAGLVRIQGDLSHPGDASRALLPESALAGRACLDVLVRQHDEWDRAVERMPASLKIVEPIAGRVASLRKHETQLDAVFSPLRHSEHPAAIPLNERYAALVSAREVPQSWADNVVDRIDEIDRALELVTDNFSLERIHAVDRAILRVATRELLEGEVPAAVVIDEALEIAKRFSTTESSSFLNGVLEGVRRQFAANRGTAPSSSPDQPN